MVSTSTFKPARKLKLAFIGGAYDSAIGRVHRAAAGMSPHFELTAGCFSLDKKRNSETALHYDVPENHTYDTLNQLLTEEASHIDAIVVLTPTDQHKEQIIQCLNAGVSVISEKALATSSNDAKEINSHLLTSNKSLLVTYNYTGYPMLRELQHMIQKGRLGKVQHIQIEMPQEGFARLDRNGNPVVPQQWRLSDADIPTLSLDLGVHLHSIIYFLTRAHPVEVVAKSASYGNFPNIIDNVSCIANYTDNILCNIWYSKTALGQRNGLKVRVYGSECSAEWVQETPELMLLADNKGNRTIFDRANVNAEICSQARYSRFKAGHPAGFIEAFANYYDDMADALHSRSENKSVTNSYVFGIEESIEGLKLLEAISRSSHTHSWEKIS